jgi:hypothetical protein
MVKSVYGMVQADSLYKADYVLSSKVNIGVFKLLTSAEPLWLNWIFATFGVKKLNKS